MTLGNIRDAIRQYLACSVADKKLILEELELTELNRIADSLLIDKRKFEQDECNRRWEASLDSQPHWTWGK